MNFEMARRSKPLIATCPLTWTGQCLGMREHMSIEVGLPDKPLITTVSSTCVFVQPVDIIRAGILVVVVFVCVGLGRLGIMSAIVLSHFIRGRSTSDFIPKKASGPYINLESHKSLPKPDGPSGRQKSLRPHLLLLLISEDFACGQHKHPPTL